MSVCCCKLPLLVFKHESFPAAGFPSYQLRKEVEGNVGYYFCVEHEEEEEKAQMFPRENIG